MLSRSFRLVGWKVEGRASWKGVRTTALNRGLDRFRSGRDESGSWQPVFARVNEIDMSRPFFTLQIMFTP